MCFGGPSGSLAGPWGSLGGPWALLRGSLGHVGGPLGLLGGVWGCLGVLGGPRGVLEGPSWRPWGLLGGSLVVPAAREHYKTQEMLRIIGRSPQAPVGGSRGPGRILWVSVGRSWGPWGSLGGLGGSLECLPSVFLGKYKQKTRGHANSSVKTVLLDIRGG